MKRQICLLIGVCFLTAFLVGLKLFYGAHLPLILALSPLWLWLLILLFYLGWVLNI